MAFILWEVVIVCALIVLNGFFAMSEMALISARRSRLEKLAEEGNRGARVALILTADQTVFLSAIQVAITLIGIFAAAFGGAQIAKDTTEVFLKTFPSLVVYAEWVALAWLSVVVVCLTVVSLVLGELIPKKIGIVYAEPIAAAVAVPMRGVATALRPGVMVLTAITRLFFKVFRLREEPEPSITEDEIKDVIEEGVQEGVIEKREQTLLENALQLGDRTVGSIMTPRPDIVWIDIRDEAKANWEEIAGSDHSHFPVCDGSLDTPLGLVSVKRLWMRQVAGQSVDLKACLVSPLFIPESARVHTLLELFKQHHRHTALVTDEFGNICGIVNQVDVLETIVGFIPTLDERAEETLVRREDGSYLIDGTYNIEDFKRRFELEAMDGESDGDFKTLGGYVLMHIGRIPRVGDHFTRQGFRFEVMDMDGRRIDKLLVVPQPRPDAERTPHTPPA